MRMRVVSAAQAGGSAAAFLAKRAPVDLIGYARSPSNSGVSPATRGVPPFRALEGGSRVYLDACATAEADLPGR
jgi:hypothetical protein